MAAYLFHQGTNYKAYEYLGAHKTDDGYVFRVWAPNAERVYVVGDFNNWTDICPMTRSTNGGVWEALLASDSVKLGDKYKYKIYNNGRAVLKSDPYGFESELPPNTATVISDIDSYKWRDGGWMAHRKRKAGKFSSEPINIYEMHLGSWKRHDDGSMYSYSEIINKSSSRPSLRWSLFLRSSKISFLEKLFFCRKSSCLSR